MQRWVIPPNSSPSQVEKILNDYVDSRLAESEEMRNWFFTRPDSVQRAIRKCPGGWLYRVKDSERQLVTVHSYNESQPNIVSVSVTREYNVTLLQRLVPDMPMDQLEPICAETEPEADQYRLNIPEEFKTALDRDEEELKSMMEIWHKEIPESVQGPERAEHIVSKMREFALAKFQKTINAAPAGLDIGKTIGRVAKKLDQQEKIAKVNSKQKVWAF